MDSSAPVPPVLPDDVEREFVDLWRRMSSLWGISPTMAQIHGLLFFCGESLSMDDLMQRLGIARSNVSMNLTRLIEWGLVRRVHRATSAFARRFCPTIRSTIRSTQRHRANDASSRPYYRSIPVPGPRRALSLHKSV